MISFDCHAHVFEKISTTPGARYAPKRPAPLVDWLANQKQHNLKGGVIVQVSFLGTDNSELCTALSTLDPQRFAGVAVVPIDVGDPELDALTAQGVRGIRWNLVRGAEFPDINALPVQALFEKLRRRNLHLEIHLEGARLATRLPELADQGIDLVVDHFGLPADPNPKSDPLIKAVNSLVNRRNLYFKFSATYRTSFDITPHANSLLDALDDDHVVWGSDWPHTQHENVVSYTETYREAFQVTGISDISAVRALYGLVAT